MASIFVGNLGAEISEQQILDLFATFGRVENVTLVKDRDTHQPRGMAFVEMPQDGEAQSAIASLDGKLVEGRPLRVNEARSKLGDDPSQPSSGARDHRRHRI
jgi:RNA recognition motif-containing protein